MDGTGVAAYGSPVTMLFLIGMLRLGLVVPRWWIIGVAVGIAIFLFWLWDATHLHPQLESGLKLWLWMVGGAAAGAAAGIGVLVRRLGRPRAQRSSSNDAAAPRS